MNQARDWRKKLGFSRKEESKRYLQAKDIRNQVDLDRLQTLNQRLADTLRKLNKSIHPDARHSDIEQLITDYVYIPFENLSRKISGFNNHGRHPEDVYWHWIQGHAISGFLRPAIARLFGVTQSDIVQNGHDDPTNPTNFLRSPAADLRISISDRLTFKVEVQSAFAEKHDIKKHKIEEAHRRLEDDGSFSALVHFDVLDGRVAVVALHKIDPHSPNWERRNELEGQEVLSLNDQYFQWWVDHQIPDLSSPETWST